MQTPRTYKAHQLIAALVTFIGFGAGFAAMLRFDLVGELLLPGLVMFVGGLLYFITARTVAWWYYG